MYNRTIPSSTNMTPVLASQKMNEKEALEKTKTRNELKTGDLVRKADLMQTFLRADKIIRLDKKHTF